jgi:hypothetical protein
VDLGERNHYFIVNGDGAELYLNNISLHHLLWLDFWSFPSLELNGYILLGAYVMCKGFFPINVRLFVLMLLIVAYDCRVTRTCY